MRELWCDECGKRKEPGTRMVLEATLEGEPAEYERVVKGAARHPKPEERVVYVNNAAIPLDKDFYICDHCNAEIRPGTRAVTWTVWADGQLEPEPWEQEYLVL